jgi:hypothetical protein
MRAQQAAGHGRGMARTGRPRPKSRQPANRGSPLGPLKAGARPSTTAIALFLTECLFSLCERNGIRHFCDGHHILGGRITACSRPFKPARAVSLTKNGTGFSMRKFSFFAATAVILAGFGGWIASTSQARVAAAIVGGPHLNAMQMMTVTANLPAEHFVDYSLVYE